VNYALTSIIGARLVVSTVLLGSAMAVELAHADPFAIDSFVFLIAATYGLSLLYLLSLRFAARRPAAVDVQFALDTVLVTAFIHVTGGISSYFSSLYVLPVVAASSVRGRGVALQVAGLSATLYTGMVGAQYLDLHAWPAWLVPVTSGLPSLGFAQYTVAINLAGILAVALLAGSLAERLRSARAGLEDASFEIADLRAFNDHVIDALVSGLITTDATGRVLTFNRAAAAITSLAAADAIRQNVREVLQFTPDLCAALERGEERRRVEVGYRTAGGRSIDIGLTMSALRFPEGTGGFLFTFQDITDYKRLEREARLQQRMAAVGEMAAGIAHEIRNPLAAMSGSMEVLREELPLSADQRQLMDIVLRESERLNERIRVFLAYATPQRPVPTRIDVCRVLHDATVALRSSVYASNSHRFRVEAPGAVDYEGDEAELRQVLWHVGTNALRAMPDGGLLRFALATDARDGGTVVLTASDEGRGIPPEEIERIFQPFRGAFTGSTGLGLAIVHRIVSDHGGRIAVSSEVGAGTTVQVTLPAARHHFAAAGERVVLHRRTA
jgi:two-component system sensor histidine kinase PilS (NtrC family)